MVFLLRPCSISRDSRKSFSRVRKSVGFSWVFMGEGCGFCAWGFWVGCGFLEDLGFLG